MKKIHLNLSVNKDLVDEARNHGLIISKFLENKLQEYFTFIEAASISPKDSTPRRRFELLRDKLPRAFQARAVPGCATSAKQVL